MQGGVGKIVFVGLSGGVDSSVAAARLKARGFTVVGVFIKVWHPEWMKCNWEQERLDAMRVAAHLEIPFLTCDAEAAYRDEVAQYFIEEYKAGRTPNPDVMCNQHVKFGRFLEFAKEKGADFIATGHYAQRIEGPDGPELHRGVDHNKDQTYFLWSLSQAQLKTTLFPVGDSPKDQIRQEAEQLGIPVATKKDSQGICFLGHVDIKEFLSHYIDLQPGSVLDESGNRIGTHQGATIYTLGQRHGFTLETHDSKRTPYFVTKRDCIANTITVGPRKLTQTLETKINLLTPTLRTALTTGDDVEYQIRYRQAPISTTIRAVSDTQIILQSSEHTEAPASGQSCVLYRGTECLGGGIVS